MITMALLTGWGFSRVYITNLLKEKFYTIDFGPAPSNFRYTATSIICRYVMIPLQLPAAVLQYFAEPHTALAYSRQIVG
jgi:hypothetical protein